MLSDQNKKTLLQVAFQSIERGLEQRREPVIEAAAYDQALHDKRATFVTLKINHRLRGCIGTLTAIRPLLEDVAHNACAAAFHDNRFEPVQASDLVSLSIHISVLNTPEDMHFVSEQDLLRQLRPGVDGVILRQGSRRATFLPSVWESIESKLEFIQHLKQKAGLTKNYWGDDIQIQRYSVEEF